MAFFQQLREHYRSIPTHPTYYSQLLFGVGVFVFSLVANVGANVYSSTHTPMVASDLLLNYLPLVNLDFIYVEAALIVILLTLFLGFYKPQRFPFLLKTVGLFIFIRSFFIILTHLTLPLPGQSSETFIPFGSLTHFFISGNDLFFSGHTGFPFLLALIFWKDRVLRYVFLGTSIFFGAAMLLGHVHYSIDVFAAFFITYTIYDLAVWLFTKDHKLFHFFLPKADESKTALSK